jgi:hypothetical protein
MINDGNYYLLAYQGKRLGSWRVDRIKEVTPTGEPRDCDEEFKALDLSNYAQCNFGMMINTKKLRVKLLCDKGLLDTMVDRFGTKGVIYTWVDEECWDNDSDHLSWFYVDYWTFLPTLKDNL